MKKFSIFLLFLTLQCFADELSTTNLVAVGQGISSPTTTSTVNYSSGYTSENPVGTLYQNKFRLTGQYDAENDNGNNNYSAFGFEAGYGQGDWGVAIGYRKPDCKDCEGATAGAVAVNVSQIGVGFRFAEKLYGAGVVFKPFGKHRFGAMLESNSTGGDGSKITTYGLGYSYVGTQVTFSLDGSGRSFEDKLIKDSRVQLTPGLMLRADKFQFSINDRITLNKDKNDPLQDDKDHDVWCGAGLAGDQWHFVVYSKYVNDLALVGSMFF